ncbi:MAG TPA: protein kinase, partial [Thermoanaerobaculia bacterium]|nr:protein kinase [Thermoanaerobaculia bacterium]
MGDVYRVEDTRLGREVALKVLKPEIASDPDRLARFRREAQVLASLDHPGIVSVYSVEEADGVHFLTMQLVQGTPLDRTIPPDGVPLDRFFDVAIPLADAVAAAHERGVVHRDLKPSNVLCAASGGVKVLDFGLAKRTGSAELEIDRDASTALMTRQGMILGTLPYMSPEQVSADPTDHRTDVFSLGVVLFELATGRRPFGGETRGELMRSILSDPPEAAHELRREVPRELAEMIDRCLAKDPRDRIQTAREVFHRLRLIRDSTSRGADAATGEERERSVAVLPFESLGGSDGAAFTEGVHGDLLIRLSKLSGLRTIARTSVRRYRDSAAQISQIGRELGVSWVVEGEVQQAGGQVQVNVRLIEAQSDRQLWAERYRRTLTAENLFDIQAEITREIAASLEVRLSPEEEQRVAHAPTASLEAYHLYTQGRISLDLRSESGAQRAVASFQGAIRRDPGFALAWAGLAEAVTVAEYYDFPLPDAAPEAIDAARRAVELEPALGEARASLGIIQAARREGPPALRELARAIELAPGHAEPHSWLAWLLLCLGRPERALAPARRAVELNPLAPAFRVFLAEALLVAGDAERALEEARRAREIQPEYALAHFTEGLVLHRQRRLAEASQALERSLALVPESGTPTRSEIHAALAVCLAAAGDEASARDQAGRVDAPASPFSAGLARASLGEIEQALLLFDQVAELHSPSVEELRYLFPEVLDPLRGEPRFRDLVARVNRSWGLQADGSLPP